MTSVCWLLWRQCLGGEIQAPVEVGRCWLRVRGRVGLASVASQRQRNSLPCLRRTDRVCGSARWDRDCRRRASEACRERMRHRIVQGIATKIRQIERAVAGPWQSRRQTPAVRARRPSTRRTIKGGAIGLDASTCRDSGTSSVRSAVRAFDAAMGKSTRRKWLVAGFRDAPIPAEAVKIMQREKKQRGRGIHGPLEHRA